MPEIILHTAPRQFRRQFLSAIRGSIIRSLAELITNSEDAYNKSANDGPESEEPITILFDRGKRQISVIDSAGGLNADEMATCFGEYGAATSGLKESMHVRGFFGKGLKDVLFSMDKGRVKSIKNGRLYVSKFKFKREKPTVDIADRHPRVNSKMRQALGIDKDGTRATFEIPKETRLPRHETLYKELSNFSMLRSILLRGMRKLVLRTINSNGTCHEDLVEYSPPTGELLTKNELELHLDGFDPFRISIEILKAPSPLTQEGNDREGGLLIVDEHDAVLDLTLYRYDTDDNASSLYGYVQIGGFRQLLIAEETVLLDTRDGLDANHEFTKKFKALIEEALAPIVESERKRKAEKGDSDLSLKNKRRIDKSIRKLNELLKELTEKDWNIVEGGHEGKPSGPIYFQYRSISIYGDKEAKITLYVDKERIEGGSIISLTSNTVDIVVKPNEIEVLGESETQIESHDLSIRGKQVGSLGILAAKSGQHQAHLEVEVVTREYPSPDNGFSFIPEKVRIPDKERKYISLYVSTKVGEVGSRIQLEVDNKAITTSLSEAEIAKSNYLGDVAKIRVPVRGLGIGNTGVITATMNGLKAQADLEVVGKRDRKKRRSGLISGYDFTNEKSRLRSRFDEETGIIWIHKKHPTINRYVAELSNDEALSLIHVQVLYADIILDQVARIARSKMIETGAAMYIGESMEDRREEDRSSEAKFIYDYGEAIHSWLVDQIEVSNAIDAIRSKNADEE